MFIVVMGVTGTGKSTLGRRLADDLGWSFCEGDDLHSATAIARMAAGHALADDDRWPWLDRIQRWIRGERAAGRSAVVTCSALRRAYRDVLRAPDVLFVHLTATPAALARRLEDRRGHFMPPELLGSQLELLEPPDPDEAAVTFDTDVPPDQVVAAVLAVVRRCRLDDPGSSQR